MKIILRDDDTSFFTTPAQLEQVYAPLWARGLPVCLGVIPNHYANICIPGEQGDFTDPNIPPAYRGQQRHYPITDNVPLCDFLNQQVKYGLIEICLHGYTHTWLEAKTDDGASFKQGLEAGLRLFADAFPGVKIKTYLAPYEQVSAVALTQILATGLTIPLHPFNVPDDFGPVPPHRAIQVGHGLIFGSAAPHPFTDPTMWLTALHENHPDVTFVCLNHGWSFFYDWGAPNRESLTRWQNWLSEMMALGAQFDVFQNIN